ncbi:hypothetical protein V6N13_114893 [Hibiscus sabdariffa]
MIEYRVPQLKNVQNGVLKSPSFSFSILVKRSEEHGFGCHRIRLLNYVRPNIFETSPHVIDAFTEAIKGMRVALGAAIVLNLFQPARKVRKCWMICNSLYIGSKDAILAVNPILDYEQNIYMVRHRVSVRALVKPSST